MGTKRGEEKKERIMEVRVKEEKSKERRRKVMKGEGSGWEK